jgi:hypothetical protein
MRCRLLVLFLFSMSTGGGALSAQSKLEPLSAVSGNIRCEKVIDYDQKTPSDKRDYVSCDYRYDAVWSPTQLTLEVGGVRVPLKREEITKYPAPGQKTALFMMFDVSDPRRNGTTTGFYPTIVRSISGARPPHLAVGVATFSQSLDLTYPIQVPRSDRELSNISFTANGAATELNRSLLDALKRLEDTVADRKLLVVISDGKAEDTAYTLRAVVSEASRLRVPIASLGIAERPSESPQLQSLRFLAEKTGGLFIDLSGKEVPNDLQSRLLSRVEVGGRITFQSSNFHGKQRVSVTLADAGGNEVSAHTEFDFPDRRSGGQKVEALFAQYWWIGLLGLFVFAAVLVGGIRYRRLLRERQLRNRLVAEFRALDGDETRYEIRKPAVTLGRSPQNDIVIANSSVSGRHAELHRTRESVFRLSDLGSTNGTVVNGVRINAVDLKDGDVVEIAEVRLQFKVVE